MNAIKEIIADFQNTPLKTGVLRRMEITAVPGKASVCIGVRRSGKSTFMFQIIQRLFDQGVSRENILYLNFFDDRLHNLRNDNLSTIHEAYYSLFPEKKNTEKVYCFFDEIQVVEGWEPFIDRLLRTENCDIYITGSSARMLSKEIATQMRGRSLSFEMFPFSFKEFLDSKAIESDGVMATKNRLFIQKAFDDFWESGGFPEVLGLDRRLRIKTHQEYFNAMLFRDLVERHDISHPRAVKDLAHYLIDNISSLYSVNNLTGYLKSRGHKVPKSGVSDYLQWFEDAYVLFTVRLFDASLSRSNANPKKIYCIDHALVTSVGSGILINSGHLLENLVFVALRHNYPDIFYYRCRSGKEVDFIVTRKDGSFMLVQVCETLLDPQTRKRETTALAEAMGETRSSEGFIVTRNEEDTVQLETGKITIVCAFRFLLSLSDTKAS